MATYNKDNFIVPVNQNTFLVIRDTSNKQRYKIYHNTVSAFMVKNNVLQIKTTSENNIICLDFSSDLEAKQALTRIRNAYIDVKTNFDNKDIKELTIEESIYLPEDNLINDGQDSFLLPDAKSILIVAINGVNIDDYTFDLDSKILNIDTDILGYIIESDDLIEIKYFI